MLASKQSMRVAPQQQQRSRLVAPAAARTARTVVALPPLRRCSQPLRVVASTMAPSPNQNGSSEEGALGGFSPSMSVPHTTMAGGGGFGSQSGLGATLERSRMNFVMPTPVVQGPKLDDGGDGGDIGKINRNGGGGGDGGGDDDDWFGEEDGDGDGEGGENRQGTGFFRTAIPEQYDKFSIGAVFAEWMKTVQDLPAILRQAVQMGLFSSAQLVRFFSVDVRPSVTRSISRHLPPSAARDFVGRLMADPGFLQKMVLEAAFASFASLWYEFRARGDRFKDELDLVFINTLGMAAATGATVWLLAPSRSYGSLQKLPWQQMLEGLPNCVFDVSGPLRSYTKQARAAGFLAKAAELSAVGAITGTATSLLSAAAVAVRQRANPEWKPSVEVPSVGRSSGGLAAFFALNANVRYQLVGGLDRFLFDRATFLWTYVALSGGARLASNQVGELSRAWWQGLPSPSTLAAPAFLTAPAMPITRRVKKKVSKRVPRSSLLLQQQQQQQGATMAAAALAPVVVALPPEAADAPAASALQLLEPEVTTQQSEAQPEQPAALHHSQQAPVAAEVEAPQPAVVMAATAAQEPLQQLQHRVAVQAIQQQQQGQQESEEESSAPGQQQRTESEDAEESSEVPAAVAPQRRGQYAVRH